MLSNTTLFEGVYDRSEFLERSGRNRTEWRSKIGTGMRKLEAQRLMDIATARQDLLMACCHECSQMCASEVVIVEYVFNGGRLFT